MSDSTFPFAAEATDDAGFDEGSNRRPIAIVGGVASTMTDADALDVIAWPVTPVIVAERETVALPLAAPAANDTTTVVVWPAVALATCTANAPGVPPHVTVRRTTSGPGVFPTACAAGVVSVPSATILANSGLVSVLSDAVTHPSTVDPAGAATAYFTPPAPEHWVVIWTSTAHTSPAAIWNDSAVLVAVASVVVKLEPRTACANCRSDRIRGRPA
jgi:hypothetical protein